MASLYHLVRPDEEGLGDREPEGLAVLRFMPAGDSGWFQRVPIVAAPNARPTLAASFAARDTFPAARRLNGVNVVGVLAGSDPALSSEAVLVSAHYDHFGIRQPVNGDSIYNGADDDASGTVAILEVASRLRAGPAPKRRLSLRPSPARKSEGWAAAGSCSSRCVRSNRRSRL